MCVISYTGNNIILRTLSENLKYDYLFHNQIPCQKVNKCTTPFRIIRMPKLLVIYADANIISSLNTPCCCWRPRQQPMN